MDADVPDTLQTLLAERGLVRIGKIDKSGRPTALDRDARAIVMGQVFSFKCTFRLDAEGIPGTQAVLVACPARPRHQTTKICFTLFQVIVLFSCFPALAYRRDRFNPQTLPFPHPSANKQPSTEGYGFRRINIC